MRQQKLYRLMMNRKYYFHEGSPLCVVLHCKGRLLKQAYVVTLLIVGIIAAIVKGMISVVTEEIPKIIYAIRDQYNDIMGILDNWNEIDTYEKERKQ